MNAENSDAKEKRRMPIPLKAALIAAGLSPLLTALTYTYLTFFTEAGPAEPGFPPLFYFFIMPTELILRPLGYNPPNNLLTVWVLPTVVNAFFLSIISAVFALAKARLKRW